MQSSKTAAEERVDRIRASLSATLLPTPSSFSASSSSSTSGSTQRNSSGTISARSRGGSGGMASMIAAYGRSKEAAEETAELGARAYLLKHNPTGLLNAGAGDRRITELNKTFLQNTIRSVESHNRREQIDSAWRQHDLLKRLDRKELHMPQDASDQEDPPHRASSHHSAPEYSDVEERSDEEQDNEGEQSPRKQGSESEEEEDFLAFSIDRSGSPTGPERPKKLNRFLKNTISSVSSHNRHLLRRAAVSTQEHAVVYDLTTTTAHTLKNTHAALNSQSTTGAKFPFRNRDEEREEGEEEEEEQEQQQQEQQEEPRSEEGDQGGDEEVEISFELDRSKTLPSHLYTADQKLYSARAASMTNRAAAHQKSRGAETEDRRERRDGGEKRKRSERRKSPVPRKRRHSSGSEASDSDNSSSSGSYGSDNDSGSDTKSGSESEDMSRSARSASRDRSAERSRSRDKSRDRGGRSDVGSSGTGPGGAGVDYQAQRELWALRKAQALHNGVYTGMTTSASAGSATAGAPFSADTDKARDKEKKSHKSHKDAKKSKKDKKEKKEKKEKKDKHEKKSKHKKHRH